MMVVDDIASMPPRKMQSMWSQPKAWPTPMPSIAMEKTMLMAAMMGAMPIFRIFLNEKSRPSAKSRNITPMSAHVWMSVLSMTDIVRGMWGETTKPATM